MKIKYLAFRFLFFAALAVSLVLPESSHANGPPVVTPVAPGFIPNFVIAFTSGINANGVLLTGPAIPGFDGQASKLTITKGVTITDKNTGADLVSYLSGTPDVAVDSTKGALQGLSNLFVGQNLDVSRTDFVVRGVKDPVSGQIIGPNGLVLASTTFACSNGTLTTEPATVGTDNGDGTFSVPFGFTSPGYLTNCSVTYNFQDASTSANDFRKGAIYSYPSVVNVTRGTDNGNEIDFQVSFSAAIQDYEGNVGLYAATDDGTATGNPSCPTGSTCRPAPPVTRFGSGYVNKCARPADACPPQGGSTYFSDFYLTPNNASLGSHAIHFCATGGGISNFPPPDMTFPDKVCTDSIVNVNPGPGDCVANLTTAGGNGGIIFQNNPLSLQWNTGSSASVTASGNWSGSKAASGSEDHTADTATLGNKTYTLNCTGASGNTDQVTVNVLVIPANGQTCDANAQGTNQFKGCVFKWTGAPGNFSPDFSNPNLKKMGSTAPEPLPALSSPAPKAAILLNDSYGAAGPNSVGDQYVVSWRGKYNFQNDTYIFTASSQAGGALYIDGALAIDDWSSSHTLNTKQSAPITLSGVHSIGYMLYDQGTDAGQISLSFAATDVCSINSLTTSVGASRSSPVPYNGSTDISWSTSNCTSVKLSQDSSGPNDVALNGTQTVSGIQSTSTFTLTATDGTNNATRTIMVFVSPAPPGSPVAQNTSLNPSVPCLSIRISWTAAVKGADSYNVYRSTNAGSPGPVWVNTGAPTTSYQYQPATTDPPYYYWVSTHNNNTGDSNLVGPTLLVSPSSCTARLGDSDKIVKDVAGRGWTYNSVCAGSANANTMVRDGEVITFSINICNRNGTLDAQNVTVKDVGVNLVNPGNYKLNGLPMSGVTYNSGSQTINFGNIGTVPVGGQAIITYTEMARRPAGSTQNLVRFSNHAEFSFNTTLPSDNLGCTGTGTDAAHPCNLDTGPIVFTYYKSPQQQETK